MRALSFLPLLLLVACGDPEGTLAGECTDNIDNDKDGVVDCEDEDCSGSADCAAGDTETWDSGGMGSYDNVQTCEDWLAGLECGEYDFTTAIDCSWYEDYSCGLSDYFTCLDENTGCDEESGVPDMTGWASCTERLDCEADSNDKWGNVQACEEWQAGAECGDYDFGDVMDCSVFSNYPCDLNEYFACLADNTGCDAKTGIPDTSGWSACSHLVSCE